MKAVAFNGSPRKQGNTAALLQRCLEAFVREGGESELIQVGGSGIQPCRNCNACRSVHVGKCAVCQDSFNEWFQTMTRADAVILGSPTYIWGMTPEMKCLVDRATYLARASLRAGGRDNPLKHKVGAALSCDAFTGSVQVVQSMQAMFFSTQMIVPGVNYWPVGRGLNPGDIQRDAEGMGYAEELGRTIAWLVKKLKG